MECVEVSDANNAKDLNVTSDSANSSITRETDDIARGTDDIIHSPIASDANLSEASADFPVTSNVDLREAWAEEISIADSNYFEARSMDDLSSSDVLSGDIGLDVEEMSNDADEFARAAQPARNLQANCAPAFEPSEQSEGEAEENGVYHTLQYLARSPQSLVHTNASTPISCSQSHKLDEGLQRSERLLETCKVASQLLWQEVHAMDLEPLRSEKDMTQSTTTTTARESPSRDDEFEEEHKLDADIFECREELKCPTSRVAVRSESGTSLATKQVMFGSASYPPLPLLSAPGQTWVASPRGDDLPDTASLHHSVWEALHASPSAKSSSSPVAPQRAASRNKGLVSEIWDFVRSTEAKQRSRSACPSNRANGGGVASTRCRAGESQRYENNSLIHSRGSALRAARELRSASNDSIRNPDREPGVHTSSEMIESADGQANVDRLKGLYFGAPQSGQGGSRATSCRRRSNATPDRQRPADGPPRISPKRSTCKVAHRCLSIDVPSRQPNMHHDQHSKASPMPKEKMMSSRANPQVGGAFDDSPRSCAPRARLGAAIAAAAGIGTTLHSGRRRRTSNTKR
jgi:hypothetical protein